MHLVLSLNQKSLVFLMKVLWIFEKVNRFGIGRRKIVDLIIWLLIYHFLQVLFTDIFVDSHVTTGCQCDLTRLFVCLMIILL